MPRLAANLSLLFTEVPFLERFDAAARAGFTGVEFQFPYAFEAAEIARAAQLAGVHMVLHNLPAGDWAAGERGIACDPSRVDAFRAGVPEALAYARELGVKRLNVLAGICPAGVSEAEAEAVLVDNLRFAAEALAAEGVRMMVEPINNKDIPGFLLNTAADGLRVLDAVAAPNAYLQYDAYHMQRSQGELTETLRGCLKRVGHIQIADVPGRHEPGTGEINYPWWLRELDAMGYRGWVGCEYIPQGRTEDGLAWMGPFAADVPP